ncbi:MAG: VanZ family protein [Woeseiaceae bacterium]
MLPLRYTHRWRIAGIVLLLVVLAATMMPAVWFAKDSRELITWFMGVDKWVHALTFLFLAVWFSGQYQRNAYWRVGVGLILFGILIEVCQQFIPYRSAEWLDLAADVGGIAVGLLIAVTGVGGWSLRAEAQLAARGSR